MLMKPKNLPSQPFEAITLHRRAAGFADRNSKTGFSNAVRRRIKAQYPLTNKAFKLYYPTKIIAGDNALRCP